MEGNVYIEEPYTIEVLSDSLSREIPAIPFFMLIKPIDNFSRVYNNVSVRTFATEIIYAGKVPRMEKLAKVNTKNSEDVSRSG